MSRKLINVLVTVVALNSVFVASTIVWPTIASSTGRASVTSVDFDQVFATVTAPMRGQAIVTQVDFDQVFASVATPRREDTPPNRERLRNIGWKRILSSR